MKILYIAFLITFTAVGADYVGNSYTESLPIEIELIKGQCYRHVDYHYGGSIAHIEELKGFGESSYNVKYTYIDTLFMKKETKTRLRDGFKQLYTKKVHCSEYARYNIKYKKHIKEQEKEREFKLLKDKVKALENRVKFIETIQNNYIIKDITDE